MSVNVELKTPNQNNITWSLSLKANSRIPIVAERSYATLADAQTWVNDLADDATAYAGAIIAVVEDGKNNGIYYVASIAQAATETSEFVPGVLVAAGAGAGSEAVESFTVTEDDKIAEAENVGQIIYVTKGTSEYPAGPYIVTGVGAVAKLGTTTATGDIAGDVENLKGRVSTAEGEIDTLQTDVNTLKTTVGDAEKGLVKDVAANAAEIATLKGAVAGGVHFRGIVDVLPGTDAGADAEWDETEGTVLGYPYPHEHVLVEDVASYAENSFTTTSGKTYSVGDIVVWSAPDDSTHAVPEPTREYILVKDEDLNPDGDGSEALGGYIFAWVLLGDTTAESQRISNIEEALGLGSDGAYDAVEAWNIAAERAEEITNALAEGMYAETSYVDDTFVEKETGKSLVSDTLVAKLEGLKEIKDVEGVLSVDTNGTLKADLSGYVAKDTEYTNLVSKVGGVESGAQVNKIEVVKVNGSALTITDKSVDIDLAASLTGKVSVNGVSFTEDTDGNLSATVDASDIYLGANIGDHTADTTTVQSLLASVYDTANSKLGSIYLAKDDATTTNVLTLSKTDVANDTITFKIAANSALSATTNGLDLVWTEL